MKKFITPFLVFLIAFTLFVLKFMPADVAFSLAKDHLPKQLKLGVVSGSLWQGEVSQLEYQKETLHKVKWDLAVLPLLTGNVAGNINFGSVRDKANISGKGLFSFGIFSKNFTLTNSRVRLPVEKILKYANLPLPVNAKGRLLANITQFDLGKPYCAQLNAKVNTQLLEIQGLSGWFAIDEIEGKLSCKSGELVVKIDKENQLGLELDALFGANNKMQVSGLVKPSGDMPKDVHDAMNFLGKPDSKGRYSFKL